MKEDVHGLRIGLDLTAFKPLQSMPHVVALLAANRQAGIPTPLLDEAFRGDGDGEASNGKGAKPGGDEGAKLVGNDGAKLVGDEGAKLIGDEGAKLVGDDGEGAQEQLPEEASEQLPPPPAPPPAAEPGAEGAPKASRAKGQKAKPKAVP